MSVVSTAPQQRAASVGNVRPGDARRRDQVLSWLLLLALWAGATGVLALSAAAVVRLVS